MVPSARTLHISAAGWSSQVARRAHNPKVRGSNPLPATKLFEACQLAGRPQTIWWPCRIWEERSDGSSPRIAGCVRSDGSSPRIAGCVRSDGSSPRIAGCVRCGERNRRFAGCVRSDGSLLCAINAVVVGLRFAIDECGEPINKSHTIHLFGVQLVANCDGVLGARRNPVRNICSGCFNL